MRMLMRKGQDWELLEPSRYLNESELQELLASGGSLIPGDASESEEAVVYCREFPTAAGPIDLVGIGSSGSITVMECKLARNRQVKREVVGQVLDYAAHLWDTDADAFVATFAGLLGQDPFDRLRGSLEHSSDWDESTARSEVTRRLADGQFRLLIAVDQIDPGLRQIIRYVNSRSARDQIRLVAIQFPLFRHGETEIVVTEMYGDEMATPPKDQRGAEARWTAEQFRARFVDDNELMRLHDAFSRWASDRGLTVVYGRGQTAPSASVQLTQPDGWYPMFLLWPGRREPSIEVPFGTLEAESRPASRRLSNELFSRLEVIDGVTIPPEKRHAWPKIPGSAFDDETVARFLDTFDWFLGELRSSLGSSPQNTGS